MSEVEKSAAMVSRRGLLKGGAFSLGGLVISTWLPPLATRSMAAEAVNTARLGDKASPGFGAFVRVAFDGRVTVISPKIEMGQGVQTGIAMMVADQVHRCAAEIGVARQQPAHDGPGQLVGRKL